MANSIPLISILVGATACVIGKAAQPLDGSQQCLLVVTDSWKSTSGTMSIFQRGSQSAWQLKTKVPVVLGRAGLGWGRGLIDADHLAGPHKREGDDKAPAGIFRLATVFGQEKQTQMPFVKMARNLVCVDDPHSRHYNRLIDETRIAKSDWRHAEKLFGVDLYRMGIVVEHNVPPQPGAGSCIFLHVWQSPATPTSGCTAMSGENLGQLIRWLDPGAAPVLVQVPRPVYAKFREEWQLPRL